MLNQICIYVLSILICALILQAKNNEYMINFPTLTINSHICDKIMGGRFDLIQLGSITFSPNKEEKLILLDHLNAYAGTIQKTVTEQAALEENDPSTFTFVFDDENNLENSISGFDLPTIIEKFYSLSSSEQSQSDSFKFEGFYFIIKQNLKNKLKNLFKNLFAKSFVLLLLSTTDVALVTDSVGDDMHKVRHTFGDNFAFIQAPPSEPDFDTFVIESQNRPIDNLIISSINAQNFEQVFTYNDDKEVNQILGIKKLFDFYLTKTERSDELRLMAPDAHTNAKTDSETLNDDNHNDKEEKEDEVEQEKKVVGLEEAKETKDEKEVGEEEDIVAMGEMLQRRFTIRGGKLIGFRQPTNELVYLLDDRLGCVYVIGGMPRSLKDLNHSPIGGGTFRRTNIPFERFFACSPDRFPFSYTFFAEIDADRCATDSSASSKSNSDFSLTEPEVEIDDDSVVRQFSIWDNFSIFKTCGTALCVGIVLVIFYVWQQYFSLRK